MKKANQLCLAATRLLAKIGFAALLGVSFGANVDSAKAAIITNNGIVTIAVIDHAVIPSIPTFEAIGLKSIEYKYTPETDYVLVMNAYNQNTTLKIQGGTNPSFEGSDRAPTVSNYTLAKPPRSDLISNTS